MFANLRDQFLKKHPIFTPQFFTPIELIQCDFKCKFPKDEHSLKEFFSSSDRFKYYQEAKEIFDSLQLWIENNDLVREVGETFDELYQRYFVRMTHHHETDQTMFELYTEQLKNLKLIVTLLNEENINLEVRKLQLTELARSIAPSCLPGKFPRINYTTYYLQTYLNPAYAVMFMRLQLAESCALDAIVEHRNMQKDNPNFAIIGPGNVHFRSKLIENVKNVLGIPASREDEIYSNTNLNLLFKKSLKKSFTPERVIENYLRVKCTMQDFYLIINLLGPEGEQNDDFLTSNQPADYYGYDSILHTRAYYQLFISIYKRLNNAGYLHSPNIKPFAENDECFMHYYPDESLKFCFLTYEDGKQKSFLEYILDLCLLGKVKELVDLIPAFSDTHKFEVIYEMSKFLKSEKDRYDFSRGDDGLEMDEMNTALQNFLMVLESRYLADFAFLKKLNCDVAINFLHNYFNTISSIENINEKSFYTHLIKNSCVELARYVTQENIKKYGLLHIAAEFSSPELFVILVDAHGDINSKDDHGNTPLHLACKVGQLDIVQFLVARNADENIPNDEGKNAYDLAYPLNLEGRNKPHLELLAYLTSIGKEIPISYSQSSLLNLACEFNHPSLLLAVLSRAELIQDVNPKSRKTFAALESAYKHRSWDAALILLKHGVDYESPTLFYNTFPIDSLLLVATQDGATEVVEWILQDKCKHGNANKLAEQVFQVALNYRQIKTAITILKSMHTFEYKPYPLVSYFSNLDEDSYLHYAAANNYLDLARALVDKNRESPLNKLQQTPLHVACIKGHIEIANYLIDYIDINQIDSKGNSVLFYAIREGHENLALLLLSKDAVWNSGVITAKKTKKILKMACEKGMLKFLQNIGVIHPNVSVKDSKYNLLHYVATNKDAALRLQQLALAKVLIADGWNINGCDNQKISPLLTAYQNKNWELFDLFLYEGADISFNNVSLLHTAYFAKNSKAFEYLCKYHCQPLDSLEPNLTLLEWALLNKFEDLAIVLINQLSQVNIKLDNFSASLLQGACYYHCDKVALHLLELGCDYHECQHFDNPPVSTFLEWAIKGKHNDIAHKLINKISSLDVSCYDGMTELGLACYYNNEEIAEYLINAGADVDRVQKHNESLLHLATVHNSVKTVRLLMEHNANPNRYNPLMQTPLHYACHNDHEEIVKILCDDARTLQDTVDSENVSPRQIAFESDSKIGACFTPKVFPRNSNGFNSTVSGTIVFGMVAIILTIFSPVMGAMIGGIGTLFGVALLAYGFGALITQYKINKAKRLPDITENEVLPKNIITNITQYQKSSSLEKGSTKEITKGIRPVANSPIGNPISSPVEIKIDIPSQVNKEHSESSPLLASSTFNKRKNTHEVTHERTNLHRTWHL